MQEESNTVALVSLVMGILGVVSGLCGCGTSWIPLVGFFAFIPSGLGLIFALVAIITGVIGIGKSKTSGVGKGQAIGGLVMGAIQLLMFIALILMIFVFAAALGLAGAAGGVH